ncbi:MAG: patatin-like phospholipase family protein [Chloroflexi bacterium]|nr:patatin-like phospholipase family protein [Chloroflexota bacterium]MBV9132709.1 patatin-like phospholipase family protein [Chloroflexota bacterium]MBV9896253.1 patatin-like phospholipase family protein [Chloroflexota bacterium]
MALPFKVLAVDGGGIRGIIPALILDEIEKRTKRPISDVFDMLSGTSTGGIIALGLTLPGPDGKPAKSAHDIVGLYEREGTTIFPTSLREVLHVETVLGAKYPADGIEKTLQRYFGDAHLKDALKPVVIPSYDIEKQVPIFFKSERAKTSPDSDFLMRQVARATSAAPTYFPPEKVDTNDPLQYYALIDGGVIANNPAMCAYAEAIKMGRVDGTGVLIVSLGTGELRHPIQYTEARKWGQVEWARPVLDIALQGSSATVDYQLQQLLATEGTDQAYFRFQLSLTQDATEMDDARDANIKHLMDLTQDYLSRPDTRDALDEVCARLTSSA